MSLSILNNIAALQAENALNSTQVSLNQTLQQLSTGQRINSGADDPAGLAIANGLQANITALTQSAQNATDGVGMFQVADGALSQVTSLLNQAVTLATEASTDTVDGTQRASLDAEYQQIQDEITQIGSNTNFNGSSVFSATAFTVFLSDGVSNSLISGTTGTLDATTLLGSATSNLTTAANAQAALTAINTAIQTVASTRGTLGAVVNRLQAASSVMSSESQNLTSSENGIMSADIGQVTANMSKYSILQQTGIAALQQANQMQQSLLKLFQ